MLDNSVETIQPKDLSARIKEGYSGKISPDAVDGLKSKSYLTYKASVRRCMDFYEGASAWISGEYLDIIDLNKASEYLPKNPSEQPDEWVLRIKRALFINWFKPAVTVVESLLSKWTFTDTPDYVLNASKNFDKQGTSIKAFALRCDRYALRDGFCGVLTSYPDYGEIPNRAVEMALDLRPYSVLIERKDIDVKEHFYKNDGSLVISKVTIDRTDINTDTEKVWEYQLTYFVDLGVIVSRAIYEYQVDDQKKKILVMTESPKPLLNTKGKPLTQIPFMLYSLTDPNPWGTMPPLMDVQQKNRKHYELYSDWLETVRKLQPTPKRVWSGSVPDNAPPLVLGGQSVIECPFGGDVVMLEASPDCVAPMIQAIDKIEASIKDTIYTFIGESFVQQSATEVSIKANQTEASLSIYSTNKESAWEQILDHWAMWESEITDASISVDLSLVKSPANVEMIKTTFEALSMGLSENDATEILQRISYLRKDQKIVKVTPNDSNVDNIGSGSSNQAS